MRLSLTPRDYRVIAVATIKIKCISEHYHEVIETYLMYKTDADHMNMLIINLIDRLYQLMETIVIALGYCAEIMLDKCKVEKRAISTMATNRWQIFCEFHIINAAGREA